MNNNEALNQIHTVSTTARWLLAGDVLVGSGFTVTRKAVRGLHTPKGKVEVCGFYPGSPERRYEWNGSTTLTVKR